MAPSSLSSLLFFPHSRHTLTMLVSTATLFFLLLSHAVQAEPRNSNGNGGQLNYSSKNNSSSQSSASANANKVLLSNSNSGGKTDSYHRFRGLDRILNRLDGGSGSNGDTSGTPSSTFHNSSPSGSNLVKRDHHQPRSYGGTTGGSGVMSTTSLKLGQRTSRSQGAGFLGSTSSLSPSLSSSSSLQTLGEPGKDFEDDLDDDDEMDDEDSYEDDEEENTTDNDELLQDKMSHWVDMRIREKVSNISGYLELRLGLLGFDDTTAGCDLHWTVSTTSIADDSERRHNNPGSVKRVERLVFYNHTECECRDKVDEMMPQDSAAYVSSHPSDPFSLPGENSLSPLNPYSAQSTLPKPNTKNNAQGQPQSSSKNSISNGAKSEATNNTFTTDDQLDIWRNDMPLRI